MITFRCAAQPRATSKPVKVPVPCRNTSSGPLPIEWTTARRPLMSNFARLNPVIPVTGIALPSVMLEFSVSAFLDRTFSLLNSAGDPEHGPMCIRAGQAKQRLAAFLNDLVRHQDVLGPGMDIAIAALHRRVVQRRAARRTVRESANFGNHVVNVAQRQLDHRHLVERGSLAAATGFGHVAPGLMHQCARRAVTCFSLGELK